MKAGKQCFSLEALSRSAGDHNAKGVSCTFLARSALSRAQQELPPLPIFFSGMPGISLVPARPKKFSVLLLWWCFFVQDFAWCTLFQCCIWDEEKFTPGSGIRGSPPPHAVFLWAYVLRCSSPIPAHTGALLAQPAHLTAYALCPPIKRLLV